MSELRTANAKKSVAVVGGGLAGIAAAIALGKHGMHVELFEAKRRLGGRTGSFFDSQGSAIDYCQHVCMKCCTNMLQLIQWLGQEREWQLEKQLHFYGPHGQYRRLQGIPWLSPPMHLATWLWNWPQLSWNSRFQITKALHRLGKLDPHEQTSTSASQWLSDQRQTAEAIENFWSTLVVSALGDKLSNVSLAAMCKVLQDGFMNNRQAYHVLIPRKPLDQLLNSDVQEALQQLGVKINLNTPIESIDQVCGQPQLTLASRHQSSMKGSVRTKEFDRMIIAVPWHQIGKLLTLETASLSEGHLVAENATRLQSSPISGIHTWWDRAWLPHRHATIVGRLCQWVFAAPESNPGSSDAPEHYYQIVVSASHELPTHDLAALRSVLLEDLRKVFPTVSQAQLMRLKIVQDPQAVFAPSVASHTLRPKTDDLGPSIKLAGDWIDTDWPSTMESAVLSGFMAAESILASYGQNVVIHAAPLPNQRWL